MLYHLGSPKKIKTMSTTMIKSETAQVITSRELLAHWQGHRNLTRRVIEAFPEKELFEFSMGGMRPFAQMAKELLAIAGPGTRQIATGEQTELQEDLDLANSKAHLLALWDEATTQIDQYWAQIPDQKFQEIILAFGEVFPDADGAGEFLDLGSKAFNRYGVAIADFFQSSLK